MAAERDPDDPPRSLTYTVNRFRNFSLLSSLKVAPFYAWLGYEVVGEAFIVVGLHEENAHMLWGEVDVLASHRREGIGKALFKRVVDAAEAEGRRLIMAATDSTIPAGEAFARRVGATVGLVEVTSELRLSNLDHVRLESWVDAAPVNEYRLLTWRGPVPEEHLEAMARLEEVMNSAPRGDLDYEDERVSPEDIRDSEAFAAARGVERWIIVAQHKESGELAGYTEVDWSPENPRLLTQNGTGVEPKHRRRGLGRWLKASMLDLVLLERNEVTHLRTSNADANEAMLKINDLLGYRPYRTRTELQIPTELARAYLLERPTSSAP